MKLPVGVLHQSAFSWCLPAPLNLFTCFQLAVGIYSLYCRFQGTPKPVCEADGNRRSQCSGRESQASVEHHAVHSSEGEVKRPRDANLDAVGLGNVQIDSF